MTSHRRTLLRRTALVLPFLAAAACADDTVSAPDGAGDGAPHSTGAAHGDSAATPGTGTTPNAVAGIRILPRQIALAVGGSTTVSVVPVDANGTPTLALLAGRPTLRIADPSIAAVGDTGSVVAKAVGTTKLYATLGTLIDSAMIVVTSASSGGGPTQRTGLQLYAPTRMTVGATAWASAILLDAQGHAVSLRGKQATWTIDDPGVVRIASTQTSDTALVAVVTAVAPGTTTLRVSLDGATQTLAMTVAAATPPSDSGSTGPSTPTVPVATFDLTAFVYGAPARPAAAGADTTPTRLAGAVVTVYRLARDAGSPPAAPNDTLGTRVKIATATSDATGQVVFRAVTGGSFYVVRAEPPAGSPYVATEAMFGPPAVADVRVGLFLQRKP